MSATFGRTTIGASNDNLPANFIVTGGPYTLPVAGTITKLSIYLLSLGAVNTVAALYADNGAGHAGARLAVSADVVSVGVAGAWYDWSLAYVALAGNYHIAYNGNNTLVWYYDGAGSANDGQNVAYPGFSNPFVPINIHTGVVSMHADYNPAGGGISRLLKNVGLVSKRPTKL